MTQFKVIIRGRRYLVEDRRLNSFVKYSTNRTAQPTARVVPIGQQTSDLHSSNARPPVYTLNPSAHII